jgi:hypothetical protein
MFMNSIIIRVMRFRVWVIVCAASMTVPVRMNDDLAFAAAMREILGTHFT